MNKVIKPTVGRKVWYRPCANDKMGPRAMQTAAGQPLDATVIAVWSDTCVNVLVTDVVGNQYPVLSCRLLQPGEEPGRDAEGNLVGRHVEWMPYQQAQA